MVRHGDDQWFDIVKWTHFAMVNAEELGITRANVDDQAKSDNPDIKRLLGTEGKHGEALGLTDDWAVRIIKHVGNYGEAFERNVGQGSALKLAAASTRSGTRAGCSTRRRSAERVGVRPLNRARPARAGFIWGGAMSVVETAKPKTALIYNPRVRGIVYQALLLAAIVFLAWAAATNAIENLARAKIASGFGFWHNTAGFDISQHLIDYSDHLDIWPRLLGWAAQHAVGRRTGHRVCDGARLHHRHRAAFDELAGGPAGRLSTSR